MKKKDWGRRLTQPGALSYRKNTTDATKTVGSDTAKQRKNNSKRKGKSGEAETFKKRAGRPAQGKSTQKGGDNIIRGAELTLELQKRGKVRPVALLNNFWVKTPI